MAMRWYSVSVLSNFEKKVKEAIEDAARQQHLEDEIVQVEVPTEQVIEIRRGKKVQTEKRFMPGYVLVKMELTDRTYHLVNSINRVTGFLGPQGKPVPMRDEEVARMLNQVVEGQERPRSIITFQTGEQVNVTDGPFEGFSGMVEEVDQANEPAQGVGVDLRPGHPGRAGIRAGLQDLVIAVGGRRGGAPAGPHHAHVAPEGRVPRAWREGGRHGQEGSGAAEAAGSRRQGEPVAARGAGAGSARHQHHGVLQGVQRPHAGDGGRPADARSSSPTSPTSPSRWRSRRRRRRSC